MVDPPPDAGSVPDRDPAAERERRALRTGKPAAGLARRPRDGGDDYTQFLYAVPVDPPSGPARVVEAGKSYGNAERTMVMFLAVLAAIVYSVFLKILVQKYKPLTIIAWQNLLGAIYFLPLFLYFDASDFFGIHAPVKVYLSLVMLGVLASCIAYVLFAFVIKQIGISKGNIYANLIPVFATLAAYFVLNEKFTTLQMGGMCIIILGVSLSVVERKEVSEPEK